MNLHSFKRSIDLRSYAASHGYRPDEALHEELAREAKDDGVEGYKGDVVQTLAVHRGAILLTRWRVERVSEARGQGVGEKYGSVDGVGLGRVDGIG